MSATHQAFDQIKRQACSLHQAIAQGWVCKCRDLHAANLVMANRTKRSVSPKPPSPVLRVAFPLQPQSWATADMTFTRQDAWSNFDTTMSLHLGKDIPTHVLPSADGISTTSSRVGTMTLAPSLFSTASKSTMPSSLGSLAEYSQKQGKEAVFTVTAGGEPFPIENLCEAIQARGRETCIGFLNDGEGSYYVFRSNESLSFTPSDVVRVVSLGTLLGYKNTAGKDLMGGTVHAQTPDLPRRSRMRIALAISYAILELYPTPWLQESFNKMDVYFFQRRDGAIIAESPFVPY